MGFYPQRFLVPLFLLALADGLILLPLPPAARLIGLALLCFLLPGWSLLAAFFPGPTDLTERLLLAVGLSYAISLLGLLYLIYLPGTISKGLLLGALTAWVILFQAMAFFRRDGRPDWHIARPDWPALLILLGLTLLLRLPLAGYSEFHEDEVEVVSLAARLAHGEDYALFLHRKGPVQTLLPLMVGLTTDRLTEGLARFPFGLAGVLAVMAVYVLAQRLVGQRVALAAGLLLAVNGMSIGFGRMVQYQSVILFLGPLAIWVFWRAYTEQDDIWAVVAALFLAVCTLAHYDTFLYYPAGLYLIGLILWRRDRRRRALVWLGVGGLVFLLVGLSFYLPYIRDPQFGNTFSYLADERIGDRFLYNNFDLFQRADQEYNSRFYLPLLCLLSAAALFRRIKSIWAGFVSLIVVALVAATYWFDGSWKVGSWNVSLLAWLVLLGWGWLILRREEGVRVALIWWVTSFIGYVFMVDKPGTHFYITYPAWVIIAGVGFDDLWQVFASRWEQVGRALLVGAGSIALGLLVYYQTLLFWQTDRGYEQLGANWDGWPARTIYDKLPGRYRYFGGPRRLGWKAVGWLLDSRTLAGDYRSANEIFSVPVWYTYQTPRSCFDDPQLYFVADPDQALPDIVQPYTPVGEVIVEGRPRIAIYRKTPNDAPPVTYNLADYAPRFDAQASLAQFTRPVEPQYPGQWRFGDSITFVGADLSAQEFAAGDILELYLYWQPTGYLTVPYRAFVHLEKDRMWGQHDDDPACRLPTTLWRPGQTIEGQFRVTIDPTTPPGEYPLTIGLYDPASGARLPVFDGQNNPLGDQLLIATISVH